MFGRIATRLRKSYRRRGLRGTVRFALDRLARPWLDLTPAGRRARRLKEQQDRAFDDRYGVDTGGIIRLDRLRIPGTTWQYGTPYWAIEPAVFVSLVGGLAIPYRDFTFVDFGSGKGRAVLLASEFPFRKVVGVEFSPELHEIARQNLRAFRSERQQCRDIELVLTDALEFALPDGPGVYYFNNPFVKEVMAGVVAGIERSCRERPREIYVLYANARHADESVREVWEHASLCRTGAATDDWTVYRSDPGRSG